MNRWLLIPLILAFLFVFFNKENDCSNVSFNTVDVSINSVLLTVFEAKTECQLRQGLMNVKKLENDGMIFIFEQPQPVSFWMKNALIPLSIAFVDENGIILEIRNMNIESKKTQSYSSESPRIKYALEVKQGFFEENNIKIGDKLVYEDVSN